MEWVQGKAGVQGAVKGRKIKKKTDGLNMYKIFFGLSVKWGQNKLLDSERVD